ncbi:MAG: UDP-N-acetylmuramoyl-tripeptide--D-alanyl-D-alanine ligase [Treponema sp.]|jgi:UDP-N-acetylmuramoyl-tripeptide--D-alanyl-D-alanine ligase|nr:UDP-N-acetylmuramoyl-tripeptide--D-alanyl-D-alanine ligase [Treponema sp.]
MMDRLMEYGELAASLGADFLSFSGEQGEGFSSVAIDSRKVLPHSLFVALRGKKADGHRFTEAAFDAGASAAMVEKRAVEGGGLAALARRKGRTLVVVNDTLRGLQDAARIYLKQFPSFLKIGITGSSGKTTTKEITAAVIGEEKKVVMNPGNLNSETGLPLSVFNVRRDHEAGVFELGMNREGEIGELAELLKPHIALVTNIGTAHIGILGSRRAIAEEKKKIFSQFTGKERALIPEADEYRDFLAEGVRGRIRYYGGRGPEGLGEIRDLGLEGFRLSWEGRPVFFRLPGRYNLANAMAALAIAGEIPVGAAAVRRGLEKARPLFGRSEILRGPVTVIRDCYNANPESMEAALEFCDGIDWPGRKIYVIGAMMELGEEAPGAHEQLGRLLAASGASEVFLYGTPALPALGALKKAGGEKRGFYTADMDELRTLLERQVREGDLVLLKGSRSCELEQLCGLFGAPAKEESAGGIGEGAA